MSLNKLLILMPALCIILLPCHVMAENNTAAEAQELINALGCKGCHKLAGDGGTLAPELDQIGSKMTRAQINKHMASHSEARQQGFMPSYDTTPKADLNKISDFLYNLK